MKTNQFRAMMLVLLMAVISLGRMNAQVITVSGTVTDAKDGNPLVGCSVQIKGTSKGAITNMKGQYTIHAGYDRMVCLIALIIINVGLVATLIHRLYLMSHTTNNEIK